MAKRDVVMSCGRVSEFQRIEATLRKISSGLKKQRGIVTDKASKTRLSLKIEKLRCLTAMTKDVRLFGFKPPTGATRSSKS